MHELSIALSILDVVAEAAEKQGAGRVKAIHLKLGLLSGVVEEALCGAFELARENSPFPGAELIVESVPVTIYCPNCREVRPILSLQHLCCTECGTSTSDILAGRELEVVALEIE